MIHDLRPYPAMKDSGVPWLGQVPEHWAVVKIKRLFLEKEDRVGSKDVPLLSLTRAQGLVLHASSTRRIASVEDLFKYKLCGPDDLVMNRMQAWSGMFSASNLTGAVSPDYSVFKMRAEGNVKFFEHLLKVPSIVDQFAQASRGIGSGFNRLYTPDFGAVDVVMPPPDEQAAIVRFLDHADRRIRKAIAAKQKLIRLLQEQKQVIIHQAVTRGLDPNVRLKPSGVEWLGDVPEGWEVRRCRYIFREVDLRSADGSEQHLSMSQRLGLVPSDLVENRTLISESYAGGKLCQVDDLVLNRLKAHLGVFATAKFDGVISPDYSVFRPIHSGETRYFESVLKSPACRRELFTRARGIVEGFWRLYTDDFYDIRLPCPSPEEQEAIIAFCDTISVKVDKQVACIEKEISLLREYRTRLIADVVTGKLDVREAALLLPEPAEEAVPEELEAGAEGEEQDADEVEAEVVEA